MNSIDNNNHFELMTTLFCIIDDFTHLIKQKSLNSKAWRKPTLSSWEVITIVIFWKLLWYTKLKWIYWHIRNYFHKYFTIPCYKNFVTLANKHSLEAIQILSILLKINHAWVKQNLYLIDSSKIAVCWNKRIFKHKVAKWFAQKWKSSMWWFYGFKIHIITDSDWNLVRVKVTPWNIDDRNPVMNLAKNLTWILVWDAGYVSQELQQKLKKEWLNFVTAVRKNMKQLMTKGQHKLLKVRQMVETSFSVLKGSNDLVSSLARSIEWHFARIVYALLAYTIAKSYLNNNQILSK